MSINEGGLDLDDDNDGLQKILSKLNVDIDVLEFLLMITMLLLLMLLASYL